MTWPCTWVLRRCGPIYNNSKARLQHSPAFPHYSPCSQPCNVGCGATCQGKSSSSALTWRSISLRLLPRTSRLLPRSNIRPCVANNSMALNLLISNCASRLQRSAPHRSWPTSRRASAQDHPCSSAAAPTLCRGAKNQLRADRRNKPNSAETDHRTVTPRELQFRAGAGVAPRFLSC